MHSHHICYDILSKNRRAGFGEFELGQEHLRELTRGLTRQARLAVIGQATPLLEDHVIEARQRNMAKRLAAQG